MAGLDNVFGAVARGMDIGLSQGQSVLKMAAMKNISLLTKSKIFSRTVGGGVSRAFGTRGLGTWASGLFSTGSMGFGKTANAFRGSYLKTAASNFWRGANIASGGVTNTNRAVLRQSMVYGGGALIGANMIFGHRRRR